MKRGWPWWQFLGFIGVSVCGVLLHFLYDWTGGSPIAALVSGVNESIWEHMKLLFFPLALLAVIEGRFFAAENSSFWCVKAVGTLIGLVTIPLLFYTYTGALGMSADWFNILIFFLSAAVAVMVETHLLEWGNLPCVPLLGKLVLIVLAVLFVVFTFFPPSIPLFRDPITGTYGI